MRKIGYAVVGLGHIAQQAVLPAFANAKENSRLVALVSSDEKKRGELSKRYGVEKTFSYEEYDACLQDEEVDAVYIALPNTLHCEYTERAAAAGVHVLCEKPMAVSEAECERMIRACEDASVRLMIAYRLHFEEANLSTVQLILSGKIGDPKFFVSEFSYQVKAGNIRTEEELGGGPLWDIGIYCVNAARSAFRSEPLEVFAHATKGADARFAEIEESASVSMVFPNNRLGSFICSYDAAPAATYRIVGTEGDVRLDNAYEYQGKIQQSVTLGGKSKTKSFSERDQFAPELLYFSRCIVEGKEPEPSGIEGLADVRVLQAIYTSLREGRPVKMSPGLRPRYAQPEQELKKPAHREPSLVEVEPPHAG